MYLFWIFFATLFLACLHVIMALLKIYNGVILHFDEYKRLMIAICFIIFWVLLVATFNMYGILYPMVKYIYFRI